tara:strand:+ start:15476 stop:17872 length:2397 start_codon:yes stop_codon:yes gene_type:complete
MSLITLNSNGQNPSMFACHFPQPIRLEPYSQVCLLKFLHFRDTDVFNITTSNNQLQFCIGNTNLDALRVARVAPGEYTGPELATAITLAMNNVLQQQNYSWVCQYLDADPTSSPPTLEGFEINFNSEVTPDNEPIDYNIQTSINIIQDQGAIRLRDTVDASSTLPNDKTVINSKGVVTNMGSSAISGIGFAYDYFIAFNPTADASFGFNSLNAGICRNELSDLNNANPSLEFNPDIQDVNLNFEQGGLQISSITFATGPGQLGKPGYATQRPCRNIPSSVWAKLITNDIDKTDDDIANIRLSFITTFIGSGRRVIIQLRVSYDLGQTYDFLATDAILGDDPAGNPYVITTASIGGDTYNGCIWQSDLPALNDVLPGTTTNASKQNLITTKKAPFKPTLTMHDHLNLLRGPNFKNTNAVWVTTTGTPGTAATWVRYTGAFNYEWVLTITGDAPLYVVSSIEIDDDATSVFDYYVNTIDEDPLAPTSPLQAAIFTFDTASGTGAKFNIEDGTTEIRETAGGTGKTALQEWEDLDYQQSGIINPAERPLTLQNVADGSVFQSEEVINYNQYAEHVELGESNSANLGADLAKTSILLLRQLNSADVVANAGSPAFLKNGQQSGTIGSTIGSSVNVIVATSSTGDTIFTSSQAVQKISKDTIIKISVPELSGVKSFNGIDQSAGKNLSGVGKDLAVLPREEFSTNGDNANGSLVYVAPFENWLDINNAQELNINQLSVEVRQPSGQIAGDLRPDTICQLKMREDPKQEARRAATVAFDNMVLAISSARDTGQILSSQLSSRGS